MLRREQRHGSGTPQRISPDGTNKKRTASGSRCALEIGDRCTDCPSCAETVLQNRPCANGEAVLGKALAVDASDI